MSPKQKYLTVSLIILSLVIGIGTITNAALTLEALTITSSGTLTINSAPTSNMAIGSTSTTGNISIGGYQTTGNIILAGSSGNVGIGTTSPTSKLDVVGNIKVSSNVLTPLISNGNAILTIGNGVNETKMIFDDSTQITQIASKYFQLFDGGSGIVEIGDSTSSSRYIKMDNENGKIEIASPTTVKIGDVSGSGSNTSITVNDGLGQNEFRNVNTVYNLGDNVSASLLGAGKFSYYFKEPYFVIAYKDGATVKYRYMDLTSTNANWIYTTTAP